MQIEKYSPTQSRNALILMLVSTLVAVAIIIFNIEFLRDVYFSNQLTKTGAFVNGLILLMFNELPTLLEQDIL